MDKEKDRLAALEEENRFLRARLRELERDANAPGDRIELLEGIMESTEDLIAAQDKNFRYLAFNSAYQRQTKRVFGIDIEIGTSMAEALADLPDDQKNAVELWGRALGGEAFTVTREFRGIGKPRVFEGHWHPLRRQGGEIFGAAQIVREVTDRVRAEEALRTSEEEFRSFFNNAAVGTTQLDLTGRLTRVNDRFCEITGYSREELLRMSPLEFTHPEDIESSRRGIFDLLHGDISTYRAEKRFIRKDGELVWTHLAASLVRDIYGTPRHTIAVIQDISDRHRMEEELRAAKEAAEEASRAKSEFLTTMSHEIRTPMTVFLAALEQLLESDRDPQCRPYLELANKSARRLRSLIEDILDFSRIEARRVEILEEPFDPRACVRNSVDILSVLARDKGLRLELNIARNMPPILIGDSDRLGQVLLNLIGNAVKFTDHGEVTVSMRTRGKHLVLSVSDTGKGIPREKRGLLFRRFSRTESLHERRHEGTGLGLAICKGLVELMGGEIGMRGRPGGGSVFFFTLPLRLPEMAEPLASADGATERVCLYPQAHILLVENDPMVREILLMLLSQPGWRTEVAESGSDAIARWQENRTDLILMDLQLPELGGLEAAGRIRELEKTKGGRTPIIALSAHARNGIRDECLEAGMDDFLLKPFRKEILLSRIARHLGG
ncbi:PAS domain S-box protein [Desulfuromonas sp. TF]|uniref:PAS domain S-box protein n=1 Tax=Desulfuromonas sp. TF TaxID=1232410 RepID=UPI00041574BD|nr:PAS domain S-box protein [Desulfuromonas sp. TF]